MVLLSTGRYTVHRDLHESEKIERAEAEAADGSTVPYCLTGALAGLHVCAPSLCCRAICSRACSHTAPRGRANSSTRIRALPPIPPGAPKAHDVCSHDMNSSTCIRPLPQPTSPPDHTPTKAQEVRSPRANNPTRIRPLPQPTSPPDHTPTKAQEVRSPRASSHQGPDPLPKSQCEAQVPTSLSPFLCCASHKAVGSLNVGSFSVPQIV